MRLRLPRRANDGRVLRTFTQSSSARTELRGRPQLPFLSVPTARTRHLSYLTPERKEKIKWDILNGTRYTLNIWLFGALLWGGWFFYGQERVERRYPTPREWSFITRMYHREGFASRYEPPQGQITSWLRVGYWFEKALNRLHDPNIDGKDVKDAPHDCPPGTKDVTAKSENWRRGYFQALMGLAKVCEYMEGWVLDKTRDTVFPPGTMIGPSNPFPKAIPAGLSGAPREEDCELRFESPDAVYLRILSTPGFSNSQKIEASLAYASWLDYKGIAGPASIIFEDAVHLAVSERPNLRAAALNPKTWTLNESAGAPSENLLTTLTAYATFRARQGDTALALPILVSLLKARRSLPVAPPSKSPTSLTAALGSAPPKDDSAATNPLTTTMELFTEAPYPAPPPDGTAPPTRTAGERCQEAALSLHIGEIMYASSNNKPHAREEGLGWTREAVDVAEEQLHTLPQNPFRDPPERVACRECLATGLGNWAAMVGKLAREAEERKKKEGETGRGKWFGGLWGGAVGAGKGAEETDRWKAEQRVIEERQKRVAELLEDLKPPPRGVLSWIRA
ncbi:hypothetical protein C8A05DRAFT_16321 [Staphylotrichum tortipilum]|uniref:Uncharacterized protein n=1 Tax=Staphylotrichum tortipilum TaxID=2831512 RepID=A0AAN6MII4_9PEZI|nr:hypothetical protein C8A05DRAFT_16321 [Staphylotrichum longicolle]